MNTQHADAATRVDVVVRSRWRHAHISIFLAVLASASTTLVLFFVRSEHAATSARVLCALLAIDAFVSFGRWRAARSRHARAESPEVARAGIGVVVVADGRDTDDRKRRIGMATAARMMIILALAGLLVASLVLDARFIAMATLMGFLTIALLGGPVWLAAIGDEEDAAG